MEEESENKTICKRLSEYEEAAEKVVKNSEFIFEII